jgi:hypothetical protein
MLTTLAAVIMSAFGTTVAPGGALFTAVAQTCNNTFPVDTNSSFCLTQSGHPTTLCRVPDVRCATDDRVASQLSVWSQEDGNCSTYAWSWTCSTLTHSPTSVPTTVPTQHPTPQPTTAPSTQPPSTQPPSTPSPITQTPTQTPTPSLVHNKDHTDKKEGVTVPAWGWLLVAVGTCALCGGVCVGYKRKSRRVGPGSLPMPMPMPMPERCVQNNLYSKA